MPFSALAIKEWYRLNHDCRSSLYKWMAGFREPEPGWFLRRSNITGRRIDVARGEIADKHAIVSAASTQESRWVYPLMTPTNASHFARVAYPRICEAALNLPCLLVWHKSDAAAVYKGDDVALNILYTRQDIYLTHTVGHVFRRPAPRLCRHCRFRR